MRSKGRSKKVNRSTIRSKPEEEEHFKLPVIKPELVSCFENAIPSLPLENGEDVSVDPKQPVENGHDSLENGEVSIDVDPLKSEQTLNSRNIKIKNACDQTASHENGDQNARDDGQSVDQEQKLLKSER